MRVHFWIAVCAAIVLVAGGQAVAQSSAIPQIGQIIDTEPFYNSKKIWGTGLCEDSSRDCSYLFYESGPEVIIMVGATAKSNADGGIIAIHVIDVARLPIKRGFKSIGECDLDGRPLLASYVNRGETEIIGFFVRDRKIQLVEGRKPKFSCSVP